jgi:galactokinase
MTDLDAFIETLRSHEILEPGADVVITRAPGRLDVMGGIADYSGSLVLQRPITEATFVALERIDRRVLEIASSGRRRYSVDLDVLAPGRRPVSYDEARALFGPDAAYHWAAYVVGVFIVLMRERGVSFSEGARIAIASSVPEGKGVSSSAALETAAMQAVSRAFAIPLEPRDLALLCQKAENLVAGAPCGVMDQMSCVYGEKDALMALLCQPAELEPAIRIPDDITFWGIDSGERHTVGGSDYRSVRAGTFMGHHLISERPGGWTDYLANISPATFEREFREWLPDEMSGAEYLARYSTSPDTVTQVEPSRTYKIRQPTTHPIYEHHRVRVFQQLLRAPSSEERRVLLGELMYQSHASYSACGLDSTGTNLIVDLVRAEGPVAGLYGARITGGGCGGTVAILGRSDASSAIARVAARYEQLTGYRPHMFSGSSSGVRAFGSLSMRL